MRGQPVKISKEDTVRNDELKIFHIPVGMRRSRMVIEHEQNAGDEKNDEKDEGDRAEVVRGPRAKRLFSNLDRQPVEEKISENGQAARAICVCGAAAKDGLPHFRLAKVLQRGMKSRCHRFSQTFRTCVGL